MADSGLLSSVAQSQYLANLTQLDQDERAFETEVNQFNIDFTSNMTNWYNTSLQEMTEISNGTNANGNTLNNYYSAMATQFGNAINAHTQLQFGQAHGAGINPGIYYSAVAAVSAHTFYVNTTQFGRVYMPAALSPGGGGT